MVCLQMDRYSLLLTKNTYVSFQCIVISNKMGISCVKKIDIILHGVPADGQIFTAPDKIYICIISMYSN